MSEPTQTVADRAAVIHDKLLDRIHRRASHVFAVLMVVQWICGIVVSLVLSPRAWEGKVQSTHIHVYAAIFLGAAISSLPIALAVTRPAWVVTRHVVAVAQILWSALLIHLTGGRIETHFHVFGSLAFLAFLYRDWRILIGPTLGVAADHFIRGVFWPESVYGTPNASLLRFAEHAFWVVFEDAVLIVACIDSSRELRDGARRRAELEALAASVGHELRNPLASIRSATNYLTKKLGAGKDLDPKVAGMLAVIDREVERGGRIIADLMRYARARPPVAEPCPLRQLVDEAVASVPHDGIAIENHVPEDIPLLSVDRPQFRDVIVHLLRNGVEATSRQQPAHATNGTGNGNGTGNAPATNGAKGRVVVTAHGGGRSPWILKVIDDGIGIPAQSLPNIFDPLFTTKTTGTGLGLAIVDHVVRAHRGRVAVESFEGKGTTITVELPAIEAGPS
ncbi:MAG: two-component sensor histidine kinase [Polyangiaceae bacterium]|nr:two-component sensor histidine kinase [Polyangiaceae bacterium]